MNPTVFEVLPDEIILHVCQYLRGADVFYSFHNLNTRLNVTITGYYRYVNLMAVSYKQFEHAVSVVLPRIGCSVRTFVLNGNWETIIDRNLSSSLFGSQLSSLFPQLEKLTVRWFTSERLLSFIDKMRDSPKLNELDIRFLKGDSSDKLLAKVLSSNNRRLTTVSFDQDSIDLDMSIDNHYTEPCTNIEELTVNLRLNQHIPHIFLFVPNLSRLHLTIDELSNGSLAKPAIQNLSVLIHLVSFQLRTVNLFWTYDEIVEILKATPNLKELSLDLRTDDKRLVTEINLLSMHCASLRKLNFFIRYYFPKTQTAKDIAQLPKSENLATVHLFDEPRSRVLVHTIPCEFHSIILTATISKQMLDGWGYMENTRDLYIYDVTSLLEILSILKHFRRLQTLAIDSRDKQQILSSPLEIQKIQIKLACLKQIEISGICDLFPLLNAAPNVDYIIIFYDCLKTQLESERTCHLLRSRIVRLNIIDWADIESDVLQKVANVFDSLRHIVITLKDTNLVIDHFVLKILSLWNNKSHLSIDVKGSLTDDATQNIRKWIVENSDMKMNDSFVVEYSDSWFDLWF